MATLDPGQGREAFRPRPLARDQGKQLGAGVEAGRLWSDAAFSLGLSHCEVGEHARGGGDGQVYAGWVYTARYSRDVWFALGRAAGPSQLSAAGRGFPCVRVYLGVPRWIYLMSWYRKLVRACES